MFFRPYRLSRWHEYIDKNTAESATPYIENHILNTTWKYPIQQCITLLYGILFANFLNCLRCCKKYFRQELIETFDKFAKLNREATIFFFTHGSVKKSPFLLIHLFRTTKWAKKRKLVIQKCFVSRGSKVWKARRTLDLNFELLKKKCPKLKIWIRCFNFIPLCSG